VFHRSQLTVMACALALWLHLPSPAQAESADSLAAEALFDQGVALLDEGSIEQACKKFHASQELDPGVGTLLHLADCHERAARFATAWRTFDEAAALAQEQGDEAREQVAKVRAAALSPRIPKLRIVAEASVLPKHYRLELDDVPIQLENWSLARALDSGPHQLEYSAPGHLTWTQEIVLVNDANPITVELRGLQRRPPPALAATQPQRPADPPPPTKAEPREAAPSSTARTLGYVLAGAGALSLGAGGVLSGLAYNAKRKTEDRCSDDLCQTPAAVDRRNDGKRYADLATVFAIAGAVTGVGGVTLILLSPSGTDSSSHSGWQVAVHGSF
jgi:hypothetical protein